MAGNTGNTTNLAIPLIKGSDLVAKESINRALERIDDAALSAKHASTNAHFQMWQKNTVYNIQDVVKTSTCPSWGFYMCKIAGLSGLIEPQGFGDGDIVADGACTWILSAFGGSSSSGAPNWQASHYYIRNSIIVHKQLLYRCLNDHLSINPFDPTKWGVLDIGYLPNWKPNAYYEPFVTIVESGKIYRVKTAHLGGASFQADIAKWEQLTDPKTKIKDWAAAENYEINECVIQDNHMYRCKTAHTSTNFIADSAAWALIDVTYADDWKPTCDYIKNEIVRYNGFMYRAKQSFTSGTSFNVSNWVLLNSSYIPSWFTGTVYEQNMTVVESGLIYRCRRAHTAAVFVNETANWEQIGGAGITVWNNGKSYKVGEMVIRNGVIYQCTVAH